jgi:hypothetical protein
MSEIKSANSVKSIKSTKSVFRRASLPLNLSEKHMLDITKVTSLRNRIKQNGLNNKNRQKALRIVFENVLLLKTETDLEILNGLINIDPNMENDGREIIKQMIKSKTLPDISCKWANCADYFNKLRVYNKSSNEILENLDNYYLYKDLDLWLSLFPEKINEKLAHEDNNTAANTIIEWAIFYDNHLLEMVLRHGANPNINLVGDFPRLIDRAFRWGNIAQMKLLKKYGAEASHEVLEWVNNLINTREYAAPNAYQSVNGHNMLKKARAILNGQRSSSSSGSSGRSASV